MDGDLPATVPQSLLTRMRLESEEAFSEISTEERFEELNKALHAMFPTNPAEPDVIAGEYFRESETEHVLAFLSSPLLSDLLDEEYAGIVSDCSKNPMSRAGAEKETY